MSDNPWGGRFGQGPNELAARFSASVDVDKRLAVHDVRGSIAHVQMLAHCGVLSEENASKVIEGLEKLSEEAQNESFAWDPRKEDVHMNLEDMLTQRVGDAGARLHTARSRNDQVATDMRLWTREACEQTMTEIDRLLAVLCWQAGQHLDILMPGYTHLQRAQPIRLSHHLLAWCMMLDRDRGRLEDARKRLNESPLGAGALATTTFPIDREHTAKALGFDRPMRNSLDAVSDRDFLVESVSALTLCAVHLSRISEELVLWSSQEFGFIEMSDAFTTGSSMMPQKKNPDMAELVRGKTARVSGHLMSLIVLLKGLPLTYNRDLQEDKLPAFDAFDTVLDSLRILSATLATCTFNRARMHNAMREGFLNATEMADYLAAKGVPFREAHHVAGRLVAKAHRAGKTLEELSIEELREERKEFEPDVFEQLDLEKAVERRDVFGGPARRRVQAAVEAFRREIEQRGVYPPAVVAMLRGT